eukprot:CAMPEP_0172559790 /NCGR_PEP_ID=MMETSP1067-20121228/85664_1 /TAXON_ID=265564 ORGANISM="Thalassiosira punctigera, Strain Tpunct2005C2" /NCGR_SAMPLE_ID=MMETSP1067 /ASSEMBLY_ACC=CAM_ASM_000444 /LENGTH=49 /DNA_ID= /DNA_START= /DNA_END= /DNA_ORIENTATION=
MWVADGSGGAECTDRYHTSSSRMIKKMGASPHGMTSCSDGDIRVLAMMA